MLDLSNLETPIFGDKESGLKFVTGALKAWEDALATYQGKADKATSKVSAILEAVVSEDEEAVKIANETMEQIRSLILAALTDNPNVAVVMFPELEDVKKAVGSYRTEATVTVQGNSDEDRDIVAEYEALDNARTMIEGTFNAWQLDVSQLPAKYIGEKKERVSQADGTTKNVPTGEKYLSFPGKLTNPNGEGKTSPGKVAVSAGFTWEVTNKEGETFTIGKSTITRLARICSNEYDLLSFDELHTRLKNKGWSATTESIEVATPRGILKGTKVNK